MRVLTLDSKSYSLKAVKKCLYWYSDRFSFDIEHNGDGNLKITIDNITENSAEELDDTLIKELKSDLIDFEVRQIINEETDMIRQLLIAKAFAPTDEYESKPPGDVSDPVGFQP